VVEILDYQSKIALCRAAEEKGERSDEARQCVVPLSVHAELRERPLVIPTKRIVGISVGEG
jgi:hypothetical protein